MSLELVRVTVIPKRRGYMHGRRNGLVGRVEKVIGVNCLSREREMLKSGGRRLETDGIGARYRWVLMRHALDEIWLTVAHCVDTASITFTVKRSERQYTEIRISSGDFPRCKYY